MILRVGFDITSERSDVASYTLNNMWRFPSDSRFDLGGEDCCRVISAAALTDVGESSYLLIEG